VPEAVIKLKQGFGRLIRTKTDRGIVVILDPRVRTKRYGRVFLESLPDCGVGGEEPFPPQWSRPASARPSGESRVDGAPFD
jgi:Rad3-related DNA helicase